MGREIKFRAWNKKSNKMVDATKFVDLIDDSSWELMQYTGFKDKRGVDIYEEDIIQFKETLYGEKFKENYVVYFKNGAFMMVSNWLTENPIEELLYESSLNMEDHKTIIDDMTVIGNSFENNELITNLT